MPYDWIVSRLGDIASIKTNSFSPAKNPEAQLEHYSISRSLENKLEGEWPMKQQIISEVMQQMLPHLDNAHRSYHRFNSCAVIFQRFLWTAFNPLCRNKSVYQLWVIIRILLFCLCCNLAAKQCVFKHVTIDNIRRILSSFFSWLEDEDYILKSPVRRIHKVKTATNIKETYTDEDLEKMRWI